jgi:hypothetical protein
MTRCTVQKLAAAVAFRRRNRASFARIDAKEGANSGVLPDLATHQGFTKTESQELLNLHGERALRREDDDDAAMGRVRGAPPAFQIARPQLSF